MLYEIPSNRSNPNLVSQVGPLTVCRTAHFQIHFSDAKWMKRLNKQTRQMFYSLFALSCILLLSAGIDFTDSSFFVWLGIGAGQLLVRQQSSLRRSNSTWERWSESVLFRMSHVKKTETRELWGTRRVGGEPVPRPGGEGESEPSASPMLLNYLPHRSEMKRCVLTAAPQQRNCSLSASISSTARTQRRGRAEGACTTVTERERERGGGKYSWKSLHPRERLCKAVREGVLWAKC